MVSADKSRQTAERNANKLSDDQVVPTVSGLVREFRRLRKGVGITRPKLESCPNLLALQQVQNETENESIEARVLACERVLKRSATTTWPLPNAAKLIERALNIGLTRLSGALGGRRLKSVEEGLGSYTSIRTEEDEALVLLAYELFDRHAHARRGLPKIQEPLTRNSGTLTVERLDILYVFSAGRVPDYWLEHKRVRAEVDGVQGILTNHLYTGAPNAIFVEAEDGCVISDEARGNFISATGFEYKEVLFVDESGAPKTLVKGETHDFSTRRTIVDRSAEPLPFAACVPEQEVDIATITTVFGGSTPSNIRRFIGPSNMIPRGEDKGPLDLTQGKTFLELKHLFPGSAYGSEWQWLDD